MAQIFQQHGHLVICFLSCCMISFHTGCAESNENGTSMFSSSMSRSERLLHRDAAKEMFLHAYRAYMDNAYPADELMPLSCKGRWRHLQPSRGDVDEALGNFSLTLVDSLDSLVVLGELEEFEHAVGLVIRDVSFNTDLIVSVFETNIRVLGGLLSAHILSEYLRDRQDRLPWYRGQLLDMALDLGTRLLPAFNTSTGIPHPRINLRHGMNVPQLSQSRETCTACAGTMILEFAALSRLSGVPVFEEKAHRAMDSLWQQRNRGSDLVGTIINIHSGDWIRPASGVGAGIDSYYEYCLKAYILLGDERYLTRFNRHYNAVMKYISQGPLLLEVQMHKPHTVTRNFMDALLAFWPGLQVLKGDIKPAIETHEMLYQVMQRHNFLPEAFTTDFQVHWGQHPLRPEMVESTYMLYRATRDPYYLNAGKTILTSLRRFAWVPCGFAAVKDVRTGQQEDRLDSFVLAETFKYLYLLFADEEDLPIDLNEFVFSTEAHLFPLSLARLSNLTVVPLRHNSVVGRPDPDVEFARSCPNTAYLFRPAGSETYTERVRRPLSSLVRDRRPRGGATVAGGSAGRPAVAVSDLRARHLRLQAGQFQSSDADHVRRVARMGISLSHLSDGRVQLMHTAEHAVSDRDSSEGLVFMQAMLELSQQADGQTDNPPRTVSVHLPPDSDVRPSVIRLLAGPAHFGPSLDRIKPVSGSAVLTDPVTACSDPSQPLLVVGRVAVAVRGDCMFADKVRRLQALGALAVVIIDNSANTAADSTAMFAMSGDGDDSGIDIPSVFLFAAEGHRLLSALQQYPDQLQLTLSDLIDEDSNSSSPDADAAVKPLGPGRGQVFAVDLNSDETVEVSADGIIQPRGREGAAPRRPLSPFPQELPDVDAKENAGGSVIQQLREWASELLDVTDGQLVEKEEEDSGGLEALRTVDSSAVWRMVRETLVDGDSAAQERRERRRRLQPGEAAPRQPLADHEAVQMDAPGDVVVEVEGDGEDVDEFGDSLVEPVLGSAEDEDGKSVSSDVQMPAETERDVAEL